MSRKIFVAIGGAAFIMAIISMFFGASIVSAYENMHVQHLNAMDQLNYFDPELVPALSRLAGIVTLPFIAAIIGMEIYVMRKTTLPKVKTISRAIACIMFLLAVLAVLMIVKREIFLFNQWGYAWVFSSLLTIAGSVVRIFIRS